MRTLLIIGLLTGAASLSAMPASAQQPNVTVGPMVSRGGPVMNRPNWGHRINGRWWGGYQAPGGWAAYRRPTVGFILPAYWLQPNYYIVDYAYYGLPAPGEGFGWSRYYDDAVLTDHYGKVYDSRVGYDWDRYGGYDDGARYAAEDVRRGDDGRAVAGAVIGGVAGGLVGSAIAGPGDRTAGAIIGAGLGAVAGAAIGDASGPGRADGPAYDAPGYRYDSGYRPLGASERKLLDEEIKQRRKLDKLARKAGYASYVDYLRARQQRYAAYAPPPPPRQPHWAIRGGPEGDGHVVRGAGTPYVETHTTPGYVANGYYYPGVTTTTITIQPGATTTTYVTKTAGKVAKPATKVVRRKVVRADCHCN